jgi:hypothetical protein
MEQDAEKISLPRADGRLAGASETIIRLRTGLNRRNSAHHPDRHILENAVLPRPNSECEV